MGGKKPLRRPLWPPTRATASNYYPLGLDGAGGAAKPLLRAPKKPAPLHGRLPAFSGAVDAFERARKCFLEWRYFFSIILSEFLKNRVALHFPSIISDFLHCIFMQRKTFRQLRHSGFRSEKLHRQLTSGSITIPFSGSTQPNWFCGWSSATVHLPIFPLARNTMLCG